MNLVGTRIGNIRVETLIGRGGMGEVYRGRDEKLDRPVALKIMRRQMHVSVEHRARFLREARLLSKLDHPGICRVYDLVAIDDTDCLILEYIEGRNLNAAREDLPRQEDRLRVAARVADALAVAHEQGIVHRDLKPENIMVTPDGGVKVLDFGVARMVVGEGDPDPDPAPPPAAPLGDPDELASMTTFTRDGDLVGTVHFMSPEQARGEQVTPAADLYSLGIVLHELVSGEHAYGPDRPRAGHLLNLVTHARTHPLEGVDPEVSALVSRLTAASPPDRPTAREMAAEIRHLLERPARTRRRRWTAAAVAASVLLLLGAVALTAHLSRPQPLLTEDQRGRVVLLPFTNQTGDPGLDWTEPGLMEMVAQSLHETEGIEVVDREQVEETCTRLGVEPDAGLTDDQAADLAREARAELVIATSVGAVGDEFQLEYTTRNVNGSTSTRRVVASELTEGANELGLRLAIRLNPDAVWIEISDRYSENPLANQLYAMGQERRSTTGSLAAESYFEICLDLDPQFVRAMASLARAEHSLGDMERFQELSERLAQQLEQTPDTEALTALYGLKGRHMTYMGDLDAALGYRLRAVDLAARRQSRHDVAHYVRVVGETYTLMRRTEEAERALLLSRDVAESAGNRSQVREADFSLAHAALHQQRYPEAKEIVERTLEDAREVGATHEMGSCYRMLGFIANREGDYATALEHFQLALEYSALDGWQHGAAVRHLDIGRLQIKLESYDEAVQSLRRAMEIFETIEQAEWVNRCRMNLVDAYLGQGDLETAEQILEEFGDGFGDQIWKSWTEARVVYAKGQYRRAVDLAEKVREQVGADWDPDDQEYLDVYRRAARDRRRYPLPHDPEYVAGGGE